MLFSFLAFFFFSSRRRHTRFDCDWSSDVCSSDLLLEGEANGISHGLTFSGSHFALGGFEPRAISQRNCLTGVRHLLLQQRSEERRVGKECRYRWWAEDVGKRRRVLVHWRTSAVSS